MAQPYGILKKVARVLSFDVAASAACMFPQFCLTSPAMYPAPTAGTRVLPGTIAFPIRAPTVEPPATAATLAIASWFIVQFFLQPINSLDNMQEFPCD